MAPSGRDPETHEHCPLCERSIAEDLRAPDYCDGCGCLLREWPPRDGAEDALPPGVTRRADRALTGRTARGPYREPVEAARLDVLVEHRQPRFGAGQVASAVSALVFVSIVSELPTAMMAGVAALAVGVSAWSLIPRLSVVRFIATPDSLTVVGDGVPLRQGQSFLADDVEGVFVRALARASRQEDRRLELVLPAAVNRFCAGSTTPGRCRGSPLMSSGRSGSMSKRGRKRVGPRARAGAERIGWRAEKWGREASPGQVERAWRQARR